MSCEVFMSSVDLTLVMPQAPAAGPRGFVSGLLGELELELDRRLPSTPEVIVIPRLELELECDARGEQELIGELARRLAAQIALAVSSAPWRSPFPLPASADSAAPAAEQGSSGLTARQSTLFHLAQAAAGGASWEVLSQATMPQHSSIARSSDARAAIDSLLRGAEPLRLLGWFARAGQLVSLLDLLDPDTALAVLFRVEEALRDGGVTAVTNEDRLSAASWWAEALEQVQRLHPADDSPGRYKEAHATIECVLAIAEIARLGPAPVSLSAGLRSVILEAIRKATVASPSFLALAHEGTVPELASMRSRTVASPGCLSAPSASADTGGETSLPQTIERIENPGVAEDFRWLWTKAGGLGFFVGPLIDLGLWEAIQAIRRDPALAVYWILRRILVNEAPHLAADPAAAALAGLLAIPNDKDRRRGIASWSGAAAAALARACGSKADTPLGAFDAWASTAAVELRRRLGEECGDLGGCHELLALEGMITEHDEGIELTLQYPALYRALLVGGLLTDLEHVPFLGGRSLRFLFRH